MAITIQRDDWRAKAQGLDGQTGTHVHLISFALAKGFDVERDDNDQELTFIARPGDVKFGHRVIGEIRGGDKAVLKITVKL